MSHLESDCLVSYDSDSSNEENIQRKGQIHLNIRNHCFTHNQSRLSKPENHFMDHKQNSKLNVQISNNQSELIIESKETPRKNLEGKQDQQESKIQTKDFDLNYFKLFRLQKQPQPESMMLQKPDQIQRDNKQLSIESKHGVQLQNDIRYLQNQISTKSYQIRTLHNQKLGGENHFFYLNNFQHSLQNEVSNNHCQNNQEIEDNIRLDSQRQKQFINEQVAQKPSQNIIIQNQQQNYQGNHGFKLNKDKSEHPQIQIQKMSTPIRREVIVKKIQLIFNELQIKDNYIKVKSIITLDTVLDALKFRSLKPNKLTGEDFEKIISIACVLTSWNEFNNQGDFRFKDSYKILNLEQTKQNHELVLNSNNKMIEILLNEYKKDNLIQESYDFINQYQTKSLEEINILSQQQKDDWFFLESEIKEEIFNQYVKGLFKELLTKELKIIQENSLQFQSSLLLKALHQAKMRLVINIYTQNINEDRLMIITQSEEEQISDIIYAARQFFNYLKERFQHLITDSMLE